MRNCSLTCLILGLLIAGNLHAQQSGGLVSFRVLTFERVKGLKTIHIGRAGKRPVASGETAIKMHKNNFSGPYRAASRHIKFFQPPAEGVAADAPMRSAGAVRLPESLGRKVILIALPADENTYQFYPIADQINKFPKGGVLLVNLTKFEIAGRLNQNRHQLAARSIKNIGTVSKQQKNHSYPVEFFFKKTKQWTPLTSSYWLHEPDVRNLTFFFTDPKTQRIRIRTIRELPEPKEENPEN